MYYVFKPNAIGPEDKDFQNKKQIQNVRIGLWLMGSEQHMNMIYWRLIGNGTNSFKRRTRTSQFRMWITT